MRTFAGGVSRFPLNFGGKVVVPLVSEADLDTVIAEAAYFVRNSNAVSLVVVHRDPKTIKNAADADKLAQLVEWTDSEALGIEVEHRPVAGDLHTACVELAKTESVGAIVAPMSKASTVRPYSRIPKTLNRLGAAGVPVLLTRGEPRFSAIVAPARRTISGDSAARAAIDIAKRAGLRVIGVAVANPSFMGTDDLMEKKHATAWLRQEASVQDVEVERHVVRGNPVKVIGEVNESGRLLVVSMPELPVSGFNPGAAVWAASRSHGSVLFVPVVD